MTRLSLQFVVVCVWYLQHFWFWIYQWFKNIKILRDLLFHFCDLDSMKVPYLYIDFVCKCYIHTSRWWIFLSKSKDFFFGATPVANVNFIIILSFWATSYLHAMVFDQSHQKAWVIHCGISDDCTKQEECLELPTIRMHAFAFCFQATFYDYCASPNWYTHYCHHCTWIHWCVGEWGETWTHRKTNPSRRGRQLREYI